MPFENDYFGLKCRYKIQLSRCKEQIDYIDCYYMTDSIDLIFLGYYKFQQVHSG